MNYFESIVNGMFPVLHTHMFGVNGKISGSIAATGEMENIMCIIHGPKGCAYYYRYSSRRRHEPFYNIFTSDLTEKDIVFGGVEKLIKTVVQVYEKYKPDLIMIISSTVSDVIHDDIDSVVRELKNHIPVISIKSELFSHRDKNFGKKRLKELSSQSVKKEENTEIELNGCGYSEFLISLVDNLMEQQEVEENIVNIESIAWGNNGSGILYEIEEFLENSGVKVNTKIPSGKYENIKKSPRASLNIARRVKWAKQMERKFNTPYLHINNVNRYSGLEGICKFYEDIYIALNNNRNSILENIKIEKERVLKETEEDRTVLKSYKGIIYGTSISMLPAEIKTYVNEYGLNVPYIVLEITEINIRDMNVDDKIKSKLVSRIYESIEAYTPNTKFFINPSLEEIKELTKSVDVVVGMTNPTVEKWGIPVIPRNTDEMTYTFNSYVRSIKRMSRRVKNIRVKPNLLLNLLNFEKSYYPLVNNQNNIASREMWSTMWLRAEEQ